MSATLVQTVSSRICYTIDPRKFLRSAVKILVDNRIGALPVIGTDKILKGIISERDIIREVHRSDNFQDLNVEQVMTKNVITCSLEARANEIMEMMTLHRIRHVPIVDGRVLHGIVSIGDVVSRLLNKYKDEAELLKNYINS